MESGAGLKKRLGIVFYIAVFLVVEMLFGYFILQSRSIFVKNSMKQGGYLAQAQTEKIEKQMEEYAAHLLSMFDDMERGLRNWDFCRNRDELRLRQTDRKAGGRKRNRLCRANCRRISKAGRSRL